MAEATQPKVEIVHTRDPDGYCDIWVFVDGVQIERYTEVSIDPGAGIERSAYEENREDARTRPEYSEAFRAKVLWAYEQWQDNKYIYEED